MNVILLRSASVIGVSVAFLTAFVWLTRSPLDNVIPAEFRGIWLDQGAECHDTEARVVITGITIDYGGMSFKADGLSGRGSDVASVTGEAFPSGKAKREILRLQMRGHRSQLLISEPDRTTGPFTRCDANADG